MTTQIEEANRRLNRSEYQLQRLYLRSWPRFLGLVLGNACNIDCPHCYQAKSGENLLKPAEIGQDLRREFSALYPFLSTLRIQGGEAFAYSGFREIIDDVRSTVERPIVSVSTNGTLIDDQWAERIVRTPFANLTVSIDGGTPETYAKLRRGADLKQVLANVERVREWKRKLNSELPVLDSFFVILRSNFREIGAYLELAANHGFQEVTLQTVEINHQNSTREPTLVEDEVIVSADEARELYDLMRRVLPPARKVFRLVRISGLQDLFERHGLDSRFLSEQENGLYPESDDLGAGGFELCPNPWTTLFVAENGDVHLCFLSEPVGNLYQEPLAAIWNSPAAIAKRSDMAAGRYARSGCSTNWCSWREGKQPAPLPDDQRARELDAVAEAAELLPILQPNGRTSAALTTVRRRLSERDERIREYAALQGHAQRHIDHLEAKTEKAVADFQALERELAEADVREEHAQSYIHQLEAQIAAPKPKPSRWTLLRQIARG